MATKALTCGNADCNLASDRKCVEGYEIDECPHAGRISIDDIPEAEEPDTVVTQPEPTIALASGEALDRYTASILQRRLVSRSIGLIGPNDSGKTSLIAGVYDLLQEGAVSGAAFAGSSTLIGFEKVCHLARAASRSAVPHTERTSRGSDATFFHLDLYQEGLGLTSLFIGDRSGEDYLAATDQISQADQFFEIRRADCITLLVNGAQLADSGLRHEVKAATPQIVDALVEARSIREGCRLAIVLTKKDSVVASRYADRVQKDFDGLVKSISESHGAYLGEVKPFVVAASPKDCENVARGEGVGDLLLFWLHASLPPVALGDGADRGFERMIDILIEKGTEN
ncbi:hypothetical protein [Massilia sp. METH4]|uniref:TRAFAC clade GTPase domain-containing protein n=1 Tax=Massilia sp. METH4 TaxID=3123041 RepID=UPI0030D37A1C